MKSLFKNLIFVVTLSLSCISFAVEKPAPPACSMSIEQDYGGLKQHVTNQACAREWSVYNTQMSYWNQSMTDSVNSSYTGITAPTPVNITCELEDYSCSARKQAADVEYARKKSVYDLQQQQIATATAAASQKALADRSASASGGYGNTAADTKAGSSQYGIAALAAGAMGAIHVKIAMGCTAAMGCAPPNYAMAAVQFAMMALGNKQANNMDKSAYSACTSSNQTSGTQVDCGSAPKPSVTETPKDTLPQVDSNGKCLATAPPNCDAQMKKIAELTGRSIKEIGGGIHAFASDKNKLKVDADGNVTLPDGKVIPAANLMTREGMMKAGMTGAQADGMLARLSATGLSSAGLNAQKDLKDLNGANKIEATFGDAGGGSAVSVGGKTLNGNGVGSKDMNKNRKPAGEGLTRDFNGESIGASGDDIFSMMNRRYKLKTAQDHFIEK